jgi:hypothetical protein
MRRREGDCVAGNAVAVPVSRDQSNKGRQTNRKLNNSHGIRAFRTLAGRNDQRAQLGIASVVQSSDAGRRAERGSRSPVWLSEVERRMDAFLAKTNFYGAVKTGYLELGGFGTEACIMFEHPTEGAWSAIS